MCQFVEVFIAPPSAGLGDQIIRIFRGKKKFPLLRNRQFVFTPKIEHKLVAERSEANQNSLTFPTWCSILKIVRTHFSEKIPPAQFLIFLWWQILKTKIN
ncbi:MAG: hypothetical protein A3J55_03090 [Candidatus Ryanbacteria bacterium RIFCSPHIGHO2_02_FULL_45_17b]|uniref:Uncharacterized protein n=1 Tax=Candidatus Ryanbacteria bacterium RIFCSPHIGHO2_01_FULL_45_22 TaxID=1802114 RepID=A0A1G2FYZ3_9BACT|nr:MAG: hypothetical protein A2719_00065 [Candidatus Ryanbacteria bacterium RIFCSPHIGHO2_01_FULL_45_22]OGZ46534.1 MAG: hypothetical protein A3J55_03090 [Candidatus Ryanbacteria bacterium RIFCSPHIGHO2_02_FULL_45_17b]